MISSGPLYLCYQFFKCCSFCWSIYVSGTFSFCKDVIQEVILNFVKLSSDSCSSGLLFFLQNDRNLKEKSFLFVFYLDLVISDYGQDHRTFSQHPKHSNMEFAETKLILILLCLQYINSRIEIFLETKVAKIKLYVTVKIDFYLLWRDSKISIRVY